jgi:hypothetical protein
MAVKGGEGRNQIVLDFQQKFDRKIVIGLYTSHSSCRTNDRIGFGFRKKTLNISGVSQIQLITRPDDNISVTALLQIVKQSTPHQAPVAGNIDGSKRHRTSLVQVIRAGVKLHRAMPSGFPILNFDSACRAYLLDHPGNSETHEH